MVYLLNTSYLCVKSTRRDALSILLMCFKREGVHLERSEKYLLICCFFMFSLNGLYAMILGSLLPLITTEYNLSNTIGGALISAHQAGALAAGFLAGILPLYFGRKKSLLLLFSLVVIGFVMVVLTGNPILLLVGFLFTGISRGSASNFNNAIVNEVSGGKASSLNLLHSLFAVGALLAPFLVILATAIGGDEGWRIAALTISGLVLIAIIMFSRAQITNVPKAERKDKMSYKFMKSKQYWYSIGILFFYLCAEATVNGWIVTYFIDEGIMSRQYAQMLASLLWVVILIGRLTIVFTRDKVSTRLILVLASIGTAAFYIMLLVTRNIGFITVAIAGLGLSMAGIYPTIIANIGKIIKVHPQSLGVLLLLSGIGAITMPIITGGLADRFGIFAGMSAVITAIVLMLVFVVLEIIRHRRERLQAANE